MGVPDDHQTPRVRNWRLGLGMGTKHHNHRVRGRSRHVVIICDELEDVIAGVAANGADVVWLAPRCDDKGTLVLRREGLWDITESTHTD
jgi:hypothetical protein